MLSSIVKCGCVAKIGKLGALHKWLGNCYFHVICCGIVILLDGSWIICHFCDNN